MIEANHIYHEIVVEDSGLCKKNDFFLSPLKALDHLKAIQKAKDGRFPDIIFLDINMPEMNGWEFLDKFQELKLSHPPKFVMLSSSNYHKDKERGKNHPLVFDYIEKPLEEDDLRRLFQLILHEG